VKGLFLSSIAIVSIAVVVQLSNPSVNDLPARLPHKTEPPQPQPPDVSAVEATIVKVIAKMSSLRSSEVWRCPRRQAWRASMAASSNEQC
jgi:hypothetical protein